MQAILELLKDWDFKKHGWPAVIVVLIWVAVEVWGPSKDPTCTKELEYMQKQLAIKDSINNDLINKLLIKNKIIDKQDSVYRVRVVLPAKQIIKKQKNEN